MIHKSKFILILFFIILTQSLFCSSLDLTKEEKLWIKNNPNIKVAMAVGYKPFSFKMNGKPMGLDFDLLNLIEEKTGLIFEKTQNTWGENVDNIKTKRVDIISGFGHNKEREKYVLFTQPYYSINYSLKIITKKTSNLTTI